MLLSVPLENDSNAATEVHLLSEMIEAFWHLEHLPENVYFMERRGALRVVSSVSRRLWTLVRRENAYRWN